MSPGGSNQCACPEGQEFAPLTATMTKCCIPLVPGPMCGDNVNVCCVDFSPPPSPPPPPPPASPPPPPPASPPPTCNAKLFMTPGGSNQCACPEGQEFAPLTATMTKCCIPLVPGPMCGDNVDVCCQKPSLTTPSPPPMPPPSPPPPTGCRDEDPPFCAAKLKTA